MNCAFLFDWREPGLGSDYGLSVMKAILRSGVIQNAGLHTRVSIGDMLTYMAGSHVNDFDALLGRLYQPRKFDRLKRPRFNDAATQSAIFCWLFQNLPVAAAERLDFGLDDVAGYLGAMDVTFGDPVQLAFFRHNLPEYYRFRGRAASMLYHGSNEDPDLSARAILEDQGFEVTYEDIGGRRTVFDSYIHLGHFQRVTLFKEVVGSFSGMSDEVLSEVELAIEEIHPKLFDTLASAARVLRDAETGEDLALSSLSGRRFLEALAEYWFPPRQENFEGRPVGRAQYRNRLWAYLTESSRSATPPTPELGLSLGTRMDRLVDRFNAGLHGDVDRAHVESAFSDLLRWVVDVVRMNPVASRRPYLAYGPAIIAALRRALDQDIQ